MSASSTSVPIIKALGSTPRLHYRAFLTSARTEAAKLYTKHDDAGLNAFYLLDTISQYDARRAKLLAIDPLSVAMPLVHPPYPQRPGPLAQNATVEQIGKYQIELAQVGDFQDALLTITMAVQTAVGPTIMDSIQTKHGDEIIRLPMILQHLEEHYSVLHRGDIVEIRRFVTQLRMSELRDFHKYTAALNTCFALLDSCCPHQQQQQQQQEGYYTEPQRIEILLTALAVFPCRDIVYADYCLAHNMDAATYTFASLTSYCVSHRRFQDEQQKSGV